MPKCTALLVIHLYLAPSCIILKGFAGKLIFPSQAIIPGCTFATIIVRAYMLPHADALLGSIDRVIQEHRLYIEFALALYIDDASATTSGPLGVVATWHSVITKMIVHRIEDALSKRWARH